MSAAVINQLQHLITSEQVSRVDIEAVSQLVDMSTISVSLAPYTSALAAMALTMQAFRDGHACLDLASVVAHDPDSVRDSLLSLPQLVATPETADALPRPPFVCDGDLLYLSRVYDEERAVAQQLLADNASRITIVLGGPGTGKTRYVAEYLRQLPDNEVPAIALCAPTGKASQHLKSVLDARLREAKASDAVLEALSFAPSVTTHKLLGYAPGRTPRFRFGAREHLPYSLVIVDEASMLSLSMMHRLLVALRSDAHLWLVGDPDQLASVEAGSVLADIAKGAERITSPLHERREVLTKQYRFSSDSVIAALAAAVRDGDVVTVRTILQTPSSEFTWIDPHEHQDELAELGKLVIAHSLSIQEAAADGNASLALARKAEMQVLSATREGRLGVRDWNQLVETGLGPDTTQRWYVGRPVLVTRNDSSTGLSNGDVGIVCNVDGQLRAYFGDPNAPTSISLARLPDTDTVHALTIHKSQGSEYNHAIVVMPEAGSRIVTRELLYTGITRPQRKLTLVGSLAAIERAVNTPIRRATGLANRL
jgi:exodeoxyribonuclease V alpha subunit